MISSEVPFSIAADEPYHLMITPWMRREIMSVTWFLTVAASFEL